jgi:hypothetical protein
MKTILDTGSFEFFVFSKNCTLCGGNTNLYPASWKHRLWRKGIARFGSGILYSDEVKDNVAIGDIVAHNLSFWAVSEADMPILASGDFQAILGLGPPKSAFKFAHRDIKKVRAAMRTNLMTGRPITPELHNVAARYQGSLDHANRSAPLLDNIGLTSMSVCFLKGAGSGGFHIWNDVSVLQNGFRFATIPVVGEFHWSAVLTDVRLGKGSFGETYVNKTSIAAPLAISCEGEGCSAVLDTGSSLLSAPSATVSDIHRVVNQWIIEGGTCDDLSRLPDLEFTLGGVRLSLPAESYMGFASGSLDTKTENLMPKYIQKHSELGACQPLILTSDLLSDTGRPLWVLGMPFFRKYYTNFVLSPLGVATNLSFSIADHNCEPGESPANAHLLATGLVHAPKRPSQLRVDGSKIRVPLILSTPRVAPILQDGSIM